MTELKVQDFHGKQENQKAEMIFKSPEFENIPPHLQLQFLGTLTYYLAKIVDEFLQTGDDKKAFKQIFELQEMAACGKSNEFNLISTLVAQRIISFCDKNEFYYHDLFKKHISSVIPGCKLVERDNDRKNIPDAWVEIDKEIFPVEIKKNSFDAKALRQLLRYMKVYDCDHGIAVARDYTAELPPNIIFVSIKRLEQTGREVTA